MEKDKEYTCCFTFTTDDLELLNLLKASILLGIERSMELGAINSQQLEHTLNKEMALEEAMKNINMLTRHFHTLYHFEKQLKELKEEMEDK